MTNVATTGSALIFERAVTIVIIVNSALLVWGLLDHGHEELAEHLETGCLVFFIGELLVRLRRAGWNTVRFVTRPWNSFDVIVIALSLAPMLGADTSMLRLAKLSRLIHWARHLTHLRLRRVGAGKHWLVAALIAAGVIIAPTAYTDGQVIEGSRATSHIKAVDDDTTTDTVCTGFNLGMSPDQIAGGLQRNDGRINEWQAWRDTTWPIIEGDCDKWTRSTS